MIFVVRSKEFHDCSMTTTMHFCHDLLVKITHPLKLVNLRFVPRHFNLAAKASSTSKTFEGIFKHLPSIQQFDHHCR